MFVASPRKLRHRLISLLVLLVCVTFVSRATLAQSPYGQSQFTQPRATQPNASAPASPAMRPAALPSAPPAMPHEDRVAATILVKNALIAVNQGNLTGNFTVLRDLASPGFRQKNSAGDLAAIFQNIRQQKVDLSPIVVLDPVLAPPRATSDGQLLLEGYFPSSPLQIVFQLGYLKAENGGWMIDAVSVGVRPVPSAAPTATASSTRPTNNNSRPTTPPAMATRPVDANRR